MKGGKFNLLSVWEVLTSSLAHSSEGVRRWDKWVREKVGGCSEVGSWQTYPSSRREINRERKVGGYVGDCLSYFVLIRFVLGGSIDCDIGRHL